MRSGSGPGSFEACRACVEGLRFGVPLRVGVPLRGLGLGFRGLGV